MSLPYGGKHQQIIKTKHQYHPIEYSKEEIFIEGIVCEVIHGAQYEKNIRLLSGLYFEVVRLYTNRFVGQLDKEVFMPQWPVVKSIIITQGEWRL